jgi:hypothetical protein
MSRHRAEPWIVDPATRPRRHVSLRVAARYLERERRTLNTFLDEGLLQPTWFEKRCKVDVVELVAFERRQRDGRNARDGSGLSEI